MSGLSLLAMLQSFELAVGGSAGASVVLSLGQCHRGSVTGEHLWPVFSWLERLAFSLQSPVQSLNMTSSALVRQLVAIRLVAGMLLVPLLGVGGGGWGFLIMIFSSLEKTCLSS